MLTRLYKWAREAVEPLRSYATGTLSPADSVILYTCLLHRLFLYFFLSAMNDWETGREQNDSLCPSSLYNYYTRASDISRGHGAAKFK